MQNKKTALLAGATGLVGKHLLNLLLKDDLYSKVKIIIRTQVDSDNSKLEQHKIDFDNLNKYEHLFIEVDDIFCCLGTTIKKAGFEEAFKKVDLEYPLQIAKIGKEKGADKFNIVTALGADRNSRIFYNRVKGKVENELLKLDYYNLNVFRPSLLLGERDETRTLEKIGEHFLKLISPLIIGALSRYKPIQVSKVAEAMLKTSKQNLSGIHVFESNHIQEI